ncbi:hypothetical protein D9M71_544290 [compost metagenome]
MNLIVPPKITKRGRLTSYSNSLISDTRRVTAPGSEKSKGLIIVTDYRVKSRFPPTYESIGVSKEAGI